MTKYNSEQMYAKSRSATLHGDQSLISYPFLPQIPVPGCCNYKFSSQLFEYIIYSAVYLCLLPCVKKRRPPLLVCVQESLNLWGETLFGGNYDWSQFIVDYGRARWHARIHGIARGNLKELKFCKVIPPPHPSRLHRSCLRIPLRCLGSSWSRC